MEYPAISDIGMPSGCSTMLKALRAYERGKSDAQMDERRRKSSYGRRMRKAAEKPLTRRERMVRAARIFRMLNPEKHKASMQKWERENRDKRAAINRRYYVLKSRRAKEEKPDVAAPGS